MIGWLVAAGYLACSLACARTALRHVMERVVCSGGLQSRVYCRMDHYPGCRRPQGEVRPRNMEDAARALALGAVWPITGAVLLVMATTPPTPGESKRQLAEQRQRIQDIEKENDRLMAQIGRDGRSGRD